MKKVNLSWQQHVLEELNSLKPLAFTIGTLALYHFAIGILLLCKSFCIHCTPCRFSVLYISNIHVYMERMIARTLHIQLHRRTHSIVQSPDYLRNTIALSYNTCFHCTTVACIDARYITWFNLFASHDDYFRSCKYCTNTFTYSIISAPVYDPNLNFSVAQIFCWFCWCASC